MSQVEHYEPLYPDSAVPDSYRLGLEYQDFVVNQLARRGLVISCYSSKRYQYDYGESVQGVEIKLDNGITKYGNISFEIGEKHPDDVAYVPSGILRNDNAWLYIQGNYDIIYIFPLRLLRLCYEKFVNVDEENRRFSIKDWPEERPTLRKFLMPASIAEEKYAALIIRPEK